MDEGIGARDSEARSEPTDDGVFWRHLLVKLQHRLVVDHVQLDLHLSKRADIIDSCFEFK